MQRCSHIAGFSVFQFFTIFTLYSSFSQMNFKSWWVSQTELCWCLSSPHYAGSSLKYTKSHIDLCQHLVDGMDFNSNHWLSGVAGKSDVKTNWKVFVVWDRSIFSMFFHFPSRSKNIFYWKFSCKTAQNVINFHSVANPRRKLFSFHS